MKVKRFFAQTMAEALKQVSNEMGPDAVILSNRRVGGGVEIVTALDYDENMARQRLGDKAAEATNGSRLAEMQADQHRHLESELTRSRSRIQEVREKRASAGARYTGVAFDDATLEQAEPEQPVADEAPADGAGYNSELASMKAEIESLRDLVRGNAAASQPKKPEGPGNAVQQRLSERLQEFGLGHELAGTLAQQNRNCLLYTSDAADE